MSFLKRLFDFYINSSIHVSLAVVALAVVTSIELDITIDIGLLFFCFLEVFQDTILLSMQK